MAMLISRLRTVDPWSDVPSRNKVWIYNPDVAIVTGLMPESFNMGVSNSYSNAPFSDALSMVNTYATFAQELFNKGGTVDFSAMIKEMKRKQWSGGGPLTTSITLIYLARRSAFQDVVDPVKELLKLSTARVAASRSAEVIGRTYSATVVKPPPTVDIAFGKIMHFKKALINSIKWEYSNVVDARGDPTTAVVTLDVETKTMFVHDTEDVTFSGKTITHFTDGIQV